MATGGNPCLLAVALLAAWISVAAATSLSPEQPPDASGYTTVEFSTPELILRYRKKETTHPGSCLWVLKGLASAPLEKKTSWRIPWGDEAHVGFVSTITFLLALVCSMSIVLAAPLFS